MKNEENIEEKLLALHEFIMDHTHDTLHDDEFSKLYWLLDGVKNYISEDNFNKLYDYSCELIDLQENGYDYDFESPDRDKIYSDVRVLFKKFYNKFYISIIDSITKK